MKLNVGTGVNRLAGVVEQFVGSDAGLNKALGDCEM